MGDIQVVFMYHNDHVWLWGSDLLQYTKEYTWITMAKEKFQTMNTIFFFNLFNFFCLCLRLIIVVRSWFSFHRDILPVVWSYFVARGNNLLYKIYLTTS